MRVVLFAKHDGFPARRLEARVDAFGFHADFVEEIFVALDVRAAGRADLHERESLLVRGVQLEKALQSAKTFQDSLGVVNAIDTHAEKRSLNSHLGAEGGAFFARIARFVGRM